jgi:hypothetical protein
MKRKGVSGDTATLAGSRDLTMKLRCVMFTLYFTLLQVHPTLPQVPDVVMGVVIGVTDDGCWEGRIVGEHSRGNCGGHCCGWCDGIRRELKRNEMKYN